MANQNIWNRTGFVTEIEDIGNGISYASLEPVTPVEWQASKVLLAMPAPCIKDFAGEITDILTETKGRFRKTVLQKIEAAELVFEAEIKIADWNEILAYARYYAG